MIKSFLMFILIVSTVCSFALAGEESVQAQDTLFSDHFEDMNNWTIVGPLGFDNWEIWNTNSAGGIAPPELVFKSDPVFIGDSYILSSEIIGAANHNLEIIFTYSIQWWSNIMTVGVAITSDSGASYTSIWEFAAATHYPPVTDTINFTGVENMQIALYYTGDSNDADFWYVDDLYLIDMSPVPVELVSFTANANNNNVELNWSTATEVNNSGFDIHRRNENNDYESIAFIDGHGTTTERQDYYFEDNNLEKGTYYYRLKQLDFNGIFEYSDEIMVSVSNPISFDLAQNYPNPFNPSTKIIFTIAETEFTSLKVYDVLGNEVATLVNEEKPAGEYEINFSANGLTSGVYFYTLKSNSFVQTRKMIIQK